MQPLRRTLHDDGHRLDDGVDGGGAGHWPADQRRHSRRGFAPLRPGPPRRAGASSRWCARTCACRRFSRARRSRTRFASNGAVGGSTNAVIHLLAIAGRIGVPTLSWTTGMPSGRDVPCLVDLMPSGRYLMEDFYYAGGLPAVMRELAQPAARRRPDRNGRTIGENCRTRRAGTAKSSAPMAEPLEAERASRCCAAIWPRRRRHQAVGRVSAPDEAPRPRGGLREHRGLPHAHRRPGSRRR